jgi:AcrR family transcriptional regulator
MADPGSTRRHSGDDVAAAALRLLDEYGLPDLTMRHLATTLGIQPSALYWHFPNKQALLAAVSARILAPLSRTPLEGLTLPDAVTALGSRLRACLLTYRDAAELVSSSLALGLVANPALTPLREVARRRDDQVALAEVSAEVLLHFVVGRVFHEQQRRTADSLGLLDGAGTLRPEDAVAAADDEDTFTQALAMIAAGLETSATRSTG